MFLTRSYASDFVRVEGLQKLTDVTAHDWDLYIFKELIDNALDADELDPSVGTPTIKVEMNYGRNPFNPKEMWLNISVGNNAIFPMERTENIFDLSKRISVKDYYNRPTRGAQGNALKTILGIPYALQYFYFSNYEFAPDVRPITIICNEQIVSVKLSVDELKQQVMIKVDKRAHSSTIETKTQIKVELPRFIQEHPRTRNELLKMARAFCMFNPHTNFSFTFHLWEERFNYESSSDSSWVSKYNMTSYPPAHWYRLDEFRELLYALIRQRLETSQEPPSIKKIAQEFGIPDNQEEMQAVLSTSLTDLMDNEQRLTHSGVRNLHELFCHYSRNLKPPELGEIGANHIRKYMLAEENHDSLMGLFFYKIYNSISADPTKVPFVLELALASNDSGHREVITGINNTSTYRDPFFSKPLFPPGQKEPHRGIDKLLDYYDLREDSSITLIIHLIAPTIVYENYGKSAISDENYRDVLVDNIDNVVAQFKEAIRPKDYLGEITMGLLPAILAQIAQPLTLSQLIAAVKLKLSEQNIAQISRALADPNADQFLSKAIENYQQENPITLYTRRFGRLAVPNHPTYITHTDFVGLDFQNFNEDFQVRAIVLTNRSELEELLLLLEFPLQYDLSILRSDGNRDGAIELLIRELKRQRIENSSSINTAIWIIHDASLDGIKLVSYVRNMVSARIVDI